MTTLPTPDTRIFVFGLPRSGTSMMTHICELLGVHMIHTTEENKEAHDKRYQSRFGEYHPNPNGFFEIGENQLANYMKIVATPHSGCKMIIPVIGIRWELIRMVNARVIMMVRDPKQIKDSQEAFYSTESDLAYLRSALVTQAKNLRDFNIDHIQVNYESVISNPEIEITRVRDFIQSDRSIDESVNFVKPELHRHRS